MLRELGGVFGIAAAVAVFAGAGGYASATAFTDGFAPAIGLSAGLALLGALASLALPGRRPSAAGGVPVVAADKQADRSAADSDCHVASVFAPP